MESKEITKEQALSLKGYKHACHIMLYGDTDAKLFGKIPTKHIVLMQMRFDGLLGFPGGLVNPGQESLESGLSREIGEELGVSLCVSPEDHLSTELASSPPNLVCHFFVKKMTEEELREVEKAAVVASDHGLEVMGLVRVPLFTLRNGGGLSSFLSHSFIGDSRCQLLAALRTLGLVSHHDLEAAVKRADKSLQSKAR